MIWPYCFVGFSEYVYILHFSNFYLQIDSSAIISKLYKCKIMIISMCVFRFLIFILSYLLSFLLFSISGQTGGMSSLIKSSISISAGQNRPRAVWGEPKKNELEGHEWRVVALVTHHEFSVVGSHSPALLWTHHPQVCHDHGRYFSQWNLSRGDMSLPNGGIIYCSTSWNADVMTGAGAAMLDHK